MDNLHELFVNVTICPIENMFLLCARNIVGLTLFSSMDLILGQKSHTNITFKTEKDSFKDHTDAVVRLESFRALKLTRLEDNLTINLRS